MIYVFIAIAAVASGTTAVFYTRWRVEQERLAGYKRIGKWYEHRVEELENETRTLAEQLLASGSVIRHAMPLQGPPPDEEYASDPTGLVVEKLDPRDLPYGY